LRNRRLDTVAEDATKAADMSKDNNINKAEKASAKWHLDSEADYVAEAAMVKANMQASDMGLIAPDMQALDK
jgi:hypothetical protein